MTTPHEDDAGIPGAATAPDPIAALDDAGIGTVSSAEPAASEDSPSSDDEG